MRANILSAMQIDSYWSEGYLHAPDVVPPDALQLAETVLERWVDQTVEWWVSRGLLSERHRELDLAHRLVHVWNAAGKPGYVRSPRRDLVSREMYDFMSHPALLDIAQDLLGTEEIFAHSTFNARPKLPDQLWTDTPWHQDAQYYRNAVETHIVSIWIPMQRVTEHNSCMQVAPRMHRGRLFDSHEDETGFIGLSREDRAGLEGHSVIMNAGDALCFPERTPHRALPNKSDTVRWSMDVRYVATADVTPTGSEFGFVARSAAAAQSVTSYEEWHAKWQGIPAGNY